MKNARCREAAMGPSRTRRDRNKRVVQALLVGVAIFAATQAQADPIRFDNPPGPGHFEWGAIQNIGDEVILSVVHDASNQNAIVGDPAAYRQRNTSSGTKVQIAGPTAAERVQFAFHPSMSGSLLVGVDAGVSIPTPPGMGVDGFTNAAFIWWLTAPGAPYTILPDGQETYLGVRFDLGAGEQYGWIGVVRTDVVLDAFAWGYETDPGVPIEAGIPEPGTLAMLAFGAAAALRKRRPA